MLLSLFNSISRPTAMSWYTPTKSYAKVTDVVMWQIAPHRETYSRLSTSYRPTALQVTEIYPSIIDLCPFAGVRDRLILYHAANPLIDNIISDLATAYVVQCDLIELVAVGYTTSEYHYVRVWDIIVAMKTAGELRRRDENHAAYKLPAPSIEALFNPDFGYAREAFRRLGMDQGIETYKLDPAFFGLYPELLGDDLNIVAAGLPLSPPRQEKLPRPSTLDPQTRATYEDFSIWCFDVLMQS